jgi:hypothetical protein
MNALLAIAAILTALLILTPRIEQNVTVVWEDGTTVSVQDGWTRARYSDGTECMWRADDQASGRCIDKNGKPMRLEAIK